MKKTRNGYFYIQIIKDPKSDVFSSFLFYNLTINLPSICWKSPQVVDSEDASRSCINILQDAALKTHFIFHFEDKNQCTTENFYVLLETMISTSE